MRAKATQIAVDRFVSSGGTAIPLLTSYRTPSDQLQARALVNIATQTSADVMDDYEAAEAALAANQAEVAENREALARQQEEYEQARQAAEAEVANLEQVEARRLEDERVRLEVLAIRREEELRQQNEELEVARASLEVERQRYRDLFQFAPNGYMVTDAAGTIREANRVAALLLRVEPRFLTGKPVLSFVAEDARPAFRAELNQLRTADRIGEWEARLQPRDGPPASVGPVIRGASRGAPAAAPGAGSRGR